MNHTVEDGFEDGISSCYCCSLKLRASFTDREATELKYTATLSILVALACAVPAECGGFEPPSVARTKAIPTPAETPAKVIVNGRTSTAQSILIRDLGDRIPPTFSGDRLKNTEGFTWYVSQHYALNTDFPAERANHYLTLLELAYPHLVEMFGREPTGIDQKRMAIVYAKEKQTLAQAMATRWALVGFSRWRYHLQRVQRYISVPKWRAPISPALYPAARGDAPLPSLLGSPIFARCPAGIRRGSPICCRIMSGKPASNGLRSTSSTRRQT